MKINLLEKEDVAQKLKRIKQNVFQNANKPGRWLAWKLKKQAEKRWITKLQNKWGNMLSRRRNIAQKFYEDFYKEEENVIKCFKKANLPRISEEGKSLSNRSINLEEVTWAINKKITKQLAQMHSLLNYTKLNKKY
uniref:Uncharacterized protein n=1 Tax=Micrurus surinamensis TaxID=129470 RepID=A0A2D4PGZ7_MICSU